MKLTEGKSIRDEESLLKTLTAEIQMQRNRCLRGEETFQGLVVAAGWSHHLPHELKILGSNLPYYIKASDRPYGFSMPKSFCIHALNI
jgi:hypothetical protein